MGILVKFFTYENNTCVIEESRPSGPKTKKTGTTNLFLVLYLVCFESRKKANETACSRDTTAAASIQRRSKDGEIALRCNATLYLSLSV